VVTLDQPTLDAALARATLRDATVPGCRVESAPGIDAVNVTFDGTSFRQAGLAGARFCDCVFLACTFRSADLTDCKFESCRFYDSESDRSCDFSYADLRRSRFERCDLTTAKLPRVRAFGIELIACQASGADFANADFGMGTGDFFNATFDACNLAYADFSRTNLTECVFTGSRLGHALFNDSVLERADLSGTALEGIEGRGLVLIGADLRGATFNNLNPREMDLTGVRVDPEQGLLLLRAMGIQVD
jgi:fluoroquinolone resistance protein